MASKIVRKLIPDPLRSRLRLCYILARHRKVARYCNGLIADYDCGHLPPCNFSPKKSFTKPVIWQYWGQGEDNCPEIIRICFQSVDKYAGDKYEIVRLNDNTISDYIDLPDFVLDKLESGTFMRAHFSDLLRVCLLATYGGIWADATMLLTGEIPDAIASCPFFMYQRSDDVLDKEIWESSYAYYWGWHPKFRVRSLNSFIVAQKSAPMINALSAILLYHWKHSNKMPDYFFFQILFNQLTLKHPAWNCGIVSDTLPHLIQHYLNDTPKNLSVNDVLSSTTIHKLSWKSTDVESLRRFMK